MLRRIYLRNSFQHYSSNKFYTRNAFEQIPETKKELPIATLENQYDLLADVITPWWRLDYVEQVILKKKWCRSVVEKLKSHKIPRFKTTIHDIIPSPVIESYRNKDEFSIRTGVDGNDKTVGFFLGSPASGKTFCVPPTKLISIKEEHIHLAQVFQDLIRSSPLKACHDLHDGGFWKNLVIKSNRKGDIMTIVTCHPNGASETEMDEAKELLKNRFLSSDVNITSLYFQACPRVRCSNDVAPFELLYGDNHLYETFNDITARISPDSFSQINTEAALLLYEAALRFLRVDKRSTILDLCCGIGVFSLLASKSVRGCIGIEIVKQAIEDASFNAKHNGITNCYFTAGRVEDRLGSIIKELDCASDIVPMINPGRAGINRRVIKQIRKSSNIRRLVYLSCKADGHGAIQNLVDFCSPSSDSSQPFVLTDVQGVDMFPQTHQCELILVLQR